MLDFDLTCRTCTRESVSGLKNIFDEDSDVSIASMIMSCSATDVAEGDGLPQSICTGCEADLKTAFTFKQRCENAFKDLSSMYEKFGNDIAIKQEPGEEQDLNPFETEDEEHKEFGEQLFDPSEQVAEMLVVEPELGAESDANEASAPVNEMVLAFEIQENADGVRYKCSVCEKSFSRQTHVKRHFLTHSAIKPHKCSYCEKSFARNDHLAKHETTHSKTKPFHCDQCNKTFSRPENLKLHQKRHEVPTHKRKLFGCDRCGKCFTTIKYLELHVANHNGPRRFTCKFCSEQFSDRSDLALHSRTHERPYLCSECGQRFLRNDYLQAHMRRHRGEKPYSCRFCNKGFARATDLTVHERYHTGEKTHLCNTCGKGFQRAYNLSVHMRTHTGKANLSFKLQLEEVTRQNNL